MKTDYEKQTNWKIEKKDKMEEKSEKWKSKIKLTKMRRKKQLNTKKENEEKEIYGKRI